MKKKVVLFFEMLLLENVCAYIALLEWEETILHLNKVKIWSEILVWFKYKNIK